MESAKRWMGTSDDDGGDDESTIKSISSPEAATERAPAKRKLPTRAAAVATKTPPPVPAGKRAKTELPRRTPKSLPFLKNTAIADIIAEEELNPMSNGWNSDEVIAFFRGVHCHGAFNVGTNSLTLLLRLEESPFP